jgi:hypothetical protein
MNSAPAIYPPEIGNLVQQVRLHMEWIMAWPHAIQRYAALEDIGAALAQHLESASSEAAIARAVTGE